MTIENAEKAGKLSKKLKDVCGALSVAKDARILFNYGNLFEVSFCEYSIEAVPRDIAKEALELIIKRLEEKCGKITTEIEAL